MNGVLLAGAKLLTNHEILLVINVLFRICGYSVCAGQRHTLIFIVPFVLTREPVFHRGYSQQADAVPLMGAALMGEIVLVAKIPLRMQINDSRKRERTSRQRVGFNLKQPFGTYILFEHEAYLFLPHPG